MTIRTGVTVGSSNRIGFVGIFKKLHMLGLMYAAAQVDLANEGLSILEIMILAGVPFPQRMKDLLRHTKEENDSDSNTTK